jgi:hypothetical protein
MMPAIWPSWFGRSGVAAVETLGAQVVEKMGDAIVVLSEVAELVE